MAKDQNALRAGLRTFAAEHPDGWNHQEWLGLMAELTDQGLDTSDPDRIGFALEAERLDLWLESLDVKGLGPKRRETIAERFSRVHDVRLASVEELAELPSFHRGLAEALHQAMR